MRRLLLALGVLALVGAAALVMTFRAAALPLTPLPSFKEPTPQVPAIVSIAALRTGALKSEARYAYRGGSGEERSFAVGAILVRHPRGDFLIDAGFGHNVEAHLASSNFVAREMAQLTKGTPVVDQLNAAHIDPHRLIGVVLTHAHWDHTSGLDDLRGVPVLLSQTELDFIKSGDPATELVRSFGNLAYTVYSFPSGPYLGFEESYDVFEDGSVVIVNAGGHTPGSVIPFVTLANGRRYAFVGDIVWQREGYEIPAERPWLSRRLADKDEDRVRTVVVRLHMLKERYPNLVIVPAHDSRVWDTLPKLGD